MASSLFRFRIDISVDISVDYGVDPRKVAAFLDEAIGHAIDSPMGSPVPGIAPQSVIDISYELDD